MFLVGVCLNDVLPGDLCVVGVLLVTSGEVNFGVPCSIVFLVTFVLYSGRLVLVVFFFFLYSCV